MADRFIDFDFTQGVEVLKTPLTTSSGPADGGRIIASSNDGKIHMSLLPANVGAECFTATAGEAVTANDMVYLDSNGKVRRAVATSLNTLAIGYVKTSANQNEQVTVYTSGYNNASSLDTSKPFVFLSATTPGAVTQTAPSGSNQLIQRLGYPISNSQFKLSIEGPTKVQ